MATVREFGAVGDGAADDTNALQHAIDQGSGALHFPKGVFRITRPLRLDLSRTGFSGVRGDQGAATLRMEGAGPALRIIGDHQGTSSPPMIKPQTWRRTRFPIISDFEIVGAHEEADGLEISYTMQTTVRNVVVRECRHGIRLVKRNRNFVLSGSHIFHCRDTGLFFDNVNLHQVNIFGNHISFNGRAGIRQAGGDVHNIQITGNDIEYNSGGVETLSGEIVLEAGDGLVSEYTISSNTIQATAEAPGANIVIIGPEETPPTGARLIAISGNVIGSRDKNILCQNATRVSISGNTIYGGTQLNLDLQNCSNVAVGANTIATRPSRHGSTTRYRDGIRLERCVNCTLSGNVMNDLGLNDPNSAGIELLHCRNCQINGCQLTDSQVVGLRMRQCQRCVITNNVISDSRAQPEQTIAVQVIGGQQNLIRGNALSTGKQTAIVADPAHADPPIVAISDNIEWENEDRP